MKTQQGNIEFADYVAKITGELSRMAKIRNLLLLTYLLEMTSEEADQVHSDALQKEAHQSGVESSNSRDQFSLSAA